MKNLLLLSLLFLSSCTSAQRLQPVVDEELRPYIEDFGKLMDKPQVSYRLKKAELYFDDLKSERTSVIGQCSLWSYPLTTSRIDFKYWKKASPTGRQFTVYHELAHCVCLASHTELSTGPGRFIERIGFALGLIKKKGYLKDGCPASIMHPSDFNEFCMLTHYNYYLKELKKKCN